MNLSFTRTENPTIISSFTKLLNIYYITLKLSSNHYCTHIKMDLMMILLDEKLVVYYIDSCHLIKLINPQVSFMLSHQALANIQLH